MKLIDLCSRFFARRYVRASAARIRQVGNSQKEQAYYYYFS